jgi:hypothetical protein
MIVVDLPPRTRLVPADEPGPADGLVVRLAGEEWVVRSDLGLVVEWEEP